MFTLVTNRIFLKATIIYLFLTLFSLLFTYVYELFSYGEHSIYMRMMFLAPLVGAMITLLNRFNLGWIKTKLSLQFFNTAVATAASACLVKGIIEVSGRTTSLEQPYWWASIILTVLSIVCSLIRQTSLSKD